MTIADIVSSIYAKTKTNSSSFPAADMLIDINTAYNHIVSLILGADGRWQWDDSNQTDLPVATTTITSTQADYSLATSHLQIDRVEVKNSDGTWFRLQPIDKDDYDVPLEQVFTTGTPEFYDIVGSSVILYPTPDYTQTASLRLTFQRGPALYTSAEVSTGTKEPGFSSLYHDLIPLWVAYNYALNNSLPTANGYFNEIQRKEQQLTADYAKRNADDRPRFTMKGIRFR